MILRVDPGSVAPAYEQLITQLMTAVRSGTLAPGTRLPTVRQLATNTVARAYKQLEGDGFLATNGRNGTVVATPRAAPDDDEVRAAAILFVGAARRAGLDLPGALGAIRGTW